jgi:hypothetical protein
MNSLNKLDSLLDNLARSRLFQSNFDYHFVRASGGASWLLGGSEWLFAALLFWGFWNKKAAILGALGCCFAMVGTVTIIPFMPDGWDAAAGFPAMKGNVAFLMKDFVLLAASFLFAEAGCSESVTFRGRPARVAGDWQPACSGSGRDGHEVETTLVWGDPRPSWSVLTRKGVWSCRRNWKAKSPWSLGRRAASGLRPPAAWPPTGRIVAFDNKFFEQSYAGESSIPSSSQWRYTCAKPPSTNNSAPVL